MQQKCSAQSLLQNKENSSHFRNVSPFKVFNLGMIALSLVLVSALAPFAPYQAQAVTSAEKQAEADALLSQLDSLQTELDNTTANLDKAISDEASATKLKDEAKVQEEEAVAEITETQERLGERAVETYCEGPVTYLDVIFGASTFSEFITNWEYISKINEYDADLAEEAKTAKQDAEDARILYAEQERIATEKKNEIAELQTSLEQRTTEMQTQVDSLNAEVAELMAAEEAAAEAARAAAAAEAGVTGGGGSVSPDLIASIGSFTHPCPGGTVTSTFGWRSFDNSFHKGLDLGAAAGTPIYAARGGTVIIAGYSSSAGNWVVIAHGGGVTTKYMHATSLYVSAGQSVSSGEMIASVGNTGNSFGAHLHFQLELNGTAINPYPFLY